MFTAYSTQGQLKPRLILAEGFWDGLIQAAAYLGRENVRINALKRGPRLAEAVNDCCACSVLNYIPDLHGRIIAKTTMSNNSVRSLKKSKPAVNRPVFVVMTLKSNLKKVWGNISMYRATMKLVKMENGVPSPFISVKAIVIN